MAEAEVLKDLTPELIEEISAKVEARLAESKKALVEKAAGMEDSSAYISLIEYITSKVEDFMNSTQNILDVISNPKNIEEAYASIVETEEFKALAREDLKGLPRVTAMTILAGSEAAAAHEASSLLKDQDEKASLYLDGLVDLYHKYMKDAISYGKGEDKRVVFAGEKQ